MHQASVKIIAYETIHSAERLKEFLRKLKNGRLHRAWLKLPCSQYKTKSATDCYLVSQLCNSEHNLFQ